MELKLGITSTNFILYNTYILTFKKDKSRQKFQLTFFHRRVVNIIV